jgi:hypothetical protein
VHRTSLKIAALAAVAGLSAACSGTSGSSKSAGPTRVPQAGSGTVVDGGTSAPLEASAGGLTVADGATEAEGAACDPSPPSCVPLGAGCPGGSATCCQTGADMPVGAGCAALTETCVPRCNSGADCAAGSCCIHNSSSVPASGYPPGEPGGWCVTEAQAAAAGFACMSGYGNGYVCEGTYVCGYQCAPADGGGGTQDQDEDAAEAGMISLPVTSDSGGAVVTEAGGMAVLDSRCVNATTDTLFVDGIGSAVSSSTGGFAPDLDVESGHIGWITITAPFPGDVSVSVKVGDLAAPWLQVGSTYPLTGSTHTAGLQPSPFVQIVARTGAICEVGGGDVTLNKLVLAGNGSDVEEAQVSWVGMTCVLDPFSPAGAQTNAKGAGCFHVF